MRALLSAHGMEHKHLAHALDIDPSALSRSLSGQRDFKTVEVAYIADVFNVPVSHLLDDEPKVRSSVKLAARSQPGATPAIEEALDRSKALIAVRALIGPDPHRPLPGTYDLDTNHTAWEQGEKLAQQAWWGLDRTSPLPRSLTELANLIEIAFSIDVALEPLPKGLDGLSAATDFSRLALVSTYPPAPRRRWTLAHELGHLLAGDSQTLVVDENLFASKAPAETRANAFAAAFLMPKGFLLSEVGSRTLSESVVEELLGTFEVSLDALAFRLHNVGVVNAAGRDVVRDMWRNISVTRSEDASQREGRYLPVRLVRQAVGEYVAGQLGVRPLAALFDVDADEFLALISPDEEEAAALSPDTSGVAA